MILRVLAVSAPHWVMTKNSSDKRNNFNSTDPFSLHNALRYAAWKAQFENGIWAKSNWKSKDGRKDSILLLNYFENDVAIYVRKLKELKPNLIFVGAMTLAFPGAIELAKLAKNVLGDEVIVVLGGKHCNETIYKKDEKVQHHPGSPLRLIAEGCIPAVFDLVVSGDGEEVVYYTGQIVGELVQSQMPLADFHNSVKNLQNAAGKWIAGWVDKNKNINHLESNGCTIDYDNMPTPAEIFGITANFPVFECDVTAHAYSDMSKGCSFDCFFCSERNFVNGKFVKKDTAPSRLIRQFKKIIEVAKTENKVRKISAFVEDSILLGGISRYLEEFNYLLEKENLDIEFGAQFTIDTFLNPRNQTTISKLRSNGLTYVAFGLETINEKIANQMNKNTRKNSWVSRSEQVMQVSHELNLKCGVFILWGLGESQNERLNQLQLLKSWQERYGVPNEVGLNWATVHPLQNNDVIYRYTDWGTEKESPYLDLFVEIFGEASTKYLLPNIQLPPLRDLEILREKYDELRLGHSRNGKLIKFHPEKSTGMYSNQVLTCESLVEK